MKDDLVRFGVAMEPSLLQRFDAVAEARGVTRSELLRGLVRAELVRADVARGAPAIAALTIVYDHHVRELTEKLTEFQHRLGERVRSTLHVHLDEDRCLEVIVLRGRSDELKQVADKLLATRGVTHGGIEIVTEEPTGGTGARTSTHTHHGHAHDHGHTQSRRPKRIRRR
jgi:CopG family nickel-responsive transcriptional regulator